MTLAPESCYFRRVIPRVCGLFFLFTPRSLYLNKYIKKNNKSVRRITRGRGGAQPSAAFKRYLVVKRGDTTTSTTGEEAARDRASQVCHSTPNQTESVKNLSPGPQWRGRVLSSGFYPHVEIRPDRKGSEARRGGEGRGEGGSRASEGSPKTRASVCK